jgi:hypothetical protein
MARDFDVSSTPYCRSHSNRTSSGDEPLLTPARRTWDEPRDATDTSSRAVKLAVFDRHVRPLRQIGDTDLTKVIVV